MRILSKLNVSLLCGAASVMALSIAARAQDVTTESVVVTGSRVISDVSNSPTPITALSISELQTTSPVDVPSALTVLPIFLGNSAPADTNNAANGAKGTTLNLRDFGANRTLVLFDSHRQPPSNADGTVDIDTLPQMLMKRVDIVTGGASAVYGSDAVTGVVNFVLDNHFNGIKVNANAGISTYADGAEEQIGIAAGTELFGGRGHIEGSLRYYHLDPILLNARIWGNATTWSIQGPGTAASPFVEVKNSRITTFSYGGLIACTGCAANKQQFVSNGVIGPFVHGTPTGTSNVESGGDGTANTYGALQIKQVTYQDFERFSYNINDSTTFYIQAIAAQSYTGGNHTTTYFQPGAYPNIFFSNNPFLPAAAQALLANPSGTFVDTQYTNIDNYPGAADNFNNINRNLGVAMGLDGTIFGKYDWDLYYSHAENRLKTDQPHDESSAKLAAADDAVVNPANGQIVCQVSLTQYANLYPGCVPLNRFGPTAMTTSQLNYIFIDSYSTTTQRLDDFSGSISGDVFDLPAGPIKAALNSEYRRLSYGVKANGLAGTLDCTGLRNCNSTASQSEHGGTLPQPTVTESVWEFAGEMDAPLLKDVPLIQSLNLNLAGRYTDYSLSGSVETWKIGVDYHVNDSIHFRATTSVDIRAPTLSDLYKPLSLGHSGFSDIHTGNIEQQVTMSSQGNINLVPEVARTYTAGMVLTPSFIPGLTLSADYYQIVLKNAITSLNGATAGVQQVCEASNGASPLCALFVRPLPYSDHTPANYPTNVLSETINAAVNDTDGVDVELDYGFQLGDVWDGAPGSITLRSLDDYQPANNLASFAGAPTTELPVPKGRLINMVTYNLRDWAFTVTDRFDTKFFRSTQPGILFYQIPYGKSLNYIDVNIDKKYQVDGAMIDAYFNIKNLLNTPPPLEPDSGSALGSAPYGEHLATGGSIGGIDDIGRYFIVGIRASL